jgi:hypothetical protein
MITRQARGEIMDLNDMMTIDHVVRVHPGGTVTYDDTAGVYAPEITCDYDGPFAEAQILPEHIADMVADVKRQGWSLLCGWSQQYLTKNDDPIMHASEFIGGALADHVRETPGYWVALAVELHPKEGDPEYRDGNGESDAAGWVLAHRPAPMLSDDHYGRDVITGADIALMASEDAGSHDLPYEAGERVGPKFNSVAALMLWQWSLESGQDDECGDAQYGNGWHALFRDERAVLHADGVGRVSAWTIDAREDLDKAWAGIQRGAVTEDDPDDLHGDDDPACTADDPDYCDGACNI